MYVIPSASMRRRTSFTSSSRPAAATKRSRSVATSVSSLFAPGWCPRSGAPEHTSAQRISTNSLLFRQREYPVEADRCSRLPCLIVSEIKAELLTADQRAALAAELAELEGPRRAAA